MRGWTWGMVTVAMVGCSDPVKGTNGGNTPPSITEVSLSPEPAYTNTPLLCQASGIDDPDGDAVDLAYQWAVNGTSVADTTESLDPSNTAKGDIVQCGITPSDPSTTGATVWSNEVEVLNSAPSGTGVAVDPSPASILDTLMATPSGWLDADGDSEFWRYDWFINGILGGSGGPELDNGFAKGDEVYVVVTPDDGAVLGDPIQSDVVRIVNTPPALTTATLTPDPATAASVLTCAGSGETDADGDAVEFLYQWYVNGSAVGSGGELLTAPSFGRGDAVYCEITPNDGEDDGTPVNSNTVNIGNTAPELVSVVLTPTPAIETTILTCVPTGLADADGDTISLAIRWLRNGSTISPTGTQLTGADFSRGDSIQCEVTPNDGLVNGPTLLSNVVVIQNSPPSATGVAIDPATPRTNDNVSATVSGWTDLDNDPQSYQFQWLKNGVPVAGGITSALGSSNYVKHDLLSVQATPYDGQAYGPMVVSTEVEVLNSAPALLSASVTPLAPLATDTLSCSAAGASDADGDTVVNGYQWYADASPVGTGTSTLDPSFFARGQQVVCEVTPFDGEDYGTPVLSNEVGVANSAPVIASVVLGPTPATEVSTLTCAESGVTDADGDPVALTYAWTVSGLPLAFAGNTLTGADFDKGDAVQCSVAPNDGFVNGTVVVSNLVVIGNTPPSAISVAVTPSDPRTNTPVAASVSGWTDVDGDTEGYNYQWLLNGSNLVGATGPTLASLNYSKHDLLSVRVTPNDGEALGLPLDSPQVEVLNTAPALAGASLTPGAPTVVDTLTCSATGPSDADGDAVTYSYQWYAGGFPVGPDAPTLMDPDFAKGELVYCEVTPFDGEDPGTPVVSGSVLVGNSPPTLVGATLSPSPAYEASVLSCTPTGENDPDGDPVSFGYAWTVNGIPAFPTTSTLDGTYFKKGDTVRCIVTPSDGTATGSGVTSNPVLIDNTAPSAVLAAITPATPYTNTDVFATVSGWSDDDGDAESYRYQWYKNGSIVAGATQPVLLSAFFVKNDVLSVRATPDDGTSLGTTLISADVPVLNRPPTLGSAQLTPLSPAVTDTLTCTPSGPADLDGDSVTYTYQWYVNGSPAGTGTNTLSAPDFGAGQNVSCGITPFDGTDSGAQVLSNEISVGNSSPTVDSVTLTPDPATEGSTLTCTASGVNDADGDPVSLAYSWTVNGLTIAPTTTTIDGAWFNRGNTVRCAVTPNDTIVNGPTVQSDPVTIDNTPPSIISAVINPSDPYTNDGLSASATGWSDLDSDPPGYRYQWYIGGVQVPGATSATLSASNIDRDDEVTVLITPDDGNDLGTPVLSLPVIVLNSPPTLNSASLGPASPTETTTLTCSPGSSSDLDGDTVSFTYAWSINGSSIAPTTATLDGSWFSRGNTIACTVTPTDLTDAGVGVVSNTVTAINTAPSVGAPTLTPTGATETSTLTCTPGATSDADSDPVSLSYAWEVGGSPIGATTNTLDGSWFDKDDGVRCLVTPSDGAAIGTTMLSPIVTIQNTPPTLSLASITPAAPRTTDVVTANPSGWNDIDGDSAGYQYQWYVDGGLLPGATAATLEASNYSKGDLLTVEITPFDGDDAGTGVFSADVEVQNTAPTQPTVSVWPVPADVTEGLSCGIFTGSTDADNDVVSYGYSWTVNGLPSGFTTSSVPSSATVIGETWACTAIPFDGEDYGAAHTASTVIVDATAPPAPTLNPIEPFRNSSLVAISGTAEPLSTVTLYATCDGGSSGTVGTIATAGGTFSFNFPMNFGEYCSFQVDSVDAASNVSPLSNTIFTTVCGSPDPYEGGGYGDTSVNAIDEWGPLSDDGLSTLFLEGNLLTGDPGDWFLVDTSDNAAQDHIAGRNEYDLNMTLTDGVGVYTFIVYKGSVAPANQECSAVTTGYDDYSDYFWDQGDAPNHTNTNSNLCSNNSATRNQCESMATNYYVRVLRDPAAPMSCQPYEITVTNNAL